MRSVAAAVGALVVVTLVGFALVLIRVDELESRVGAVDAGVQEVATANDLLTGRLDELESSVNELSETLSLTDGGDGSAVPPELAATLRDIADQVSELQDLVQALDDRVDEICDNVPVCGLGMLRRLLAAVAIGQ